MTKRSDDEQSAPAPCETLIARGVRLIRLHPRAKEPIDTGWQRSTGLTPDAAVAAFERGENLGALLGSRSGGLTDIDLDAPEPDSLAVMRALLPRTTMRSGRTSKPDSHHWYRSDGFSRNAFRDPLDGTLLVEIRGDGQQTAIAGTHPSGERIEGVWGEPAVVPHDRLLRALGLAATAAFLARNWHRWDDQHHELCLALAGGLAKGGYAEDEAMDLVEAVAEQVDHEPEDRLRAVRDTYAKLVAGEPVTGWAHLAALIDSDGKSAAKTLRGWLNVAITEFALTDAGNGMRFIHRHGEKVRYCPQLHAWFVWDGRRWAADDMQRAMEFARETAEAIMQEAVPGTEGEKNVRAWSKQSQMVPKLRAMLEAAGTTSGAVKVAATALDADANLLNCRNGTLELDTLMLREHRQDDLITQVTACDYDPDARSETFEHFLAEATGPAPEVRPFLQVCAGLTLLGKNVEEILVFLMGEAGSGKTTLLEALAAALGEYAASADVDSFLAADRSSGGGAPRPDLARLRGKRMVRASEPDPNRRMDTNKLKAITGGEKITVRHLYAEPFEMTPMFVPWIAANKAPQINAEDSGIWRRLLRVPLEKGRTKEERDASIKAELTNPEKSGAAVLSWAVAGLRRYREDGFLIPEIVLQRTEELRQEFDTTMEWFELDCEFGPDYEESGGELYRSYSLWARGSGVRAVSNHEFVAKLRDRGLDQRRTSGKRLWRGVRLRRLDVNALGASLRDQLHRATDHEAGSPGPGGITAGFSQARAAGQTVTANPAMTPMTPHDANAGPARSGLHPFSSHTDGLAGASPGVTGVITAQPPVLPPHGE